MAASLSSDGWCAEKRYGMQQYYEFVLNASRNLRNRKETEHSDVYLNTSEPTSAMAKPSTAPSGGVQWRSRRDCGAMSWKVR